MNRKQNGEKPEFEYSIVYTSHKMKQLSLLKLHLVDIDGVIDIRQTLVDFKVFVDRHILELALSRNFIVTLN